MQILTYTKTVPVYVILISNSLFSFKLRQGMLTVQNVRARLKLGWLAKKVIMVSCQFISKPSFHSIWKEHERKLT